MENRIQELTEKIYHEGVVKGNQEAEKIISDAEAKAASILQEAQKKADALIQQAEKQSEELHKNTLSELKLASRQAINSLKQDIIEVISVKTIDFNVKEVLGDSNFLAVAIKTLVDKWAPEKDNFNLDIVLGEKDKEKLMASLQKDLKKELDKGLEIKTSQNLRSGFQIEARDEGYKLSFTEEDFTAFFKNYLRPRLINILFE